MYREFVDQAARSDIAAAAAAHHELGPDYDGAVAESLIERISNEIDKRVDAKLGARPPRTRSLAEPAAAGGHQALLLGAGVGAGVTGLVAIISVHGSKTVVAAMITIWVILAIAGLGASVANKYRDRRRG